MLPQSATVVDLDVVRRRRRESERELTVRVAQDVSAYVIAVYGELDMSNAYQLERALTVAETAGVDEVVVDLSAVHFIDTAGVHVLTAAADRFAVDVAQDLVLLRARPLVDRVFALCGVEDELPFAG